MEIPKGFKVEGDGDYILQIHKNIYGWPKAGRSSLEQTPGGQTQVHWLMRQKAPSGSEGTTKIVQGVEHEWCAKF